MAYIHKNWPTANASRYVCWTLCAVSITTVEIQLHAADINSVEATYDLENEGLELVFDFADTSDSTTPSGLIKMGIDFDLKLFGSGVDGPFRNAIEFQGPSGSSVSAASGDTLVVEFPEPLMGAQTFALLFENVDTSLVDRSSDRSVDIQINRESLVVDSSALRFPVPPGFQGQRLNNVTHARIGSVVLGLVGDFNQSGVLDIGDLDQLAAEIKSGSTAAEFDLDQSGLVDLDDRTYWVTDVRSTLIGDADLNGVVNFSDFLVLSENFGAVAGGDGGPGWGEGDFDGDGSVGFPDFLALSENFGASAPLAAAVPEPSASWLAIFSVLGMVGSQRSRR